MLQELNPDATGITTAEVKLVTPTFLRGHRMTVHSQSNQQKLVGHLLLNELDTDAITSKVFPHAGNDVPFHCLMTGPMAPKQILLVRECVRVRRSVVRELLQWFIKRNKLYHHLGSEAGLMENRLNALPVNGIMPSMLHHDLEDSKQKEQKEPSAAVGPQAGMAGDNTGTNFTFVSSIAVDPTARATSGSVLGSAADAADDVGFHIRSSNKVVGGYLPFTLEKAFPAKFPFCRGGPSETRQVPVGMEEAIAHLARLSHGAFQTTEFTLVAYDLTECIRANKSAFVSCLQIMPDGHTRGQHFSKMTAEELRLVAWWKEECAKAQRRKRPQPPVPASLLNNGITEDFLRNMTFATGKMRHTEEYGKAARRRLWAMMAEEGKPSLFVTINPDDTGSLLVHLLRPGGEIDDAIPPLQIRAAYLTHYPGASALAFERFLEVLVGVILGWDEASKSATATGGLFGHPRAFFMAIEEQGRLSLHDHILLWLHGHDQLRERLLQPGGPERLQAYLDQALDASLPVPPSKVPAATLCPTAGCNAPLGKNQLLFELAHKFKHNLGSNPRILRCTAEGQQHCCSPDDLTDNLLADWWEERRPGEPLPVSMDAVSALKWGGLDIDSPDINLLTCVLIRRTNWHKASHMKTCSKSRKAKRTKLCRARLPADMVDESNIEILHPGCEHMRKKVDAIPPEEFAEKEWDLDEVCPVCDAQPLVSFALKRTASSVWMPQYSALLTRIFGCNNNIQYVYNQLLGFYMGMYASKGSKEGADSLKHAVEGFVKVLEKQKMRDREIARLLAAGIVPPQKEVLSEFAQGLRMMHGAWSNHTRSEQIGAPRAAFFVLGYDGWISSRGTVHLAPAAAEAMLLGRALRHTTTSKGSATPPVVDYVFRPEFLEHLCWLEFVRDYERVRLPKGESDTVMEFEDGHPDVGTHGITQRMTFLYPQVSAARCPDGSILDKAGAKEEDRVLYARNALTLTVPFRMLDSFGIDEDATDPDWWSAWKLVRDTHVTDYGRRYLKNTQDFYTQVVCNQSRNDVNIFMQDELDLLHQADGGAASMLDDDALEAMLADIVSKRPSLSNNLNLEGCRTHQDYDPYVLDPSAVADACAAMPDLIKNSKKGLDPTDVHESKALDVEYVSRTPSEIPTFVAAVMEAVLPRDVLAGVSDVPAAPDRDDPGKPREPLKRLETIRASLADIIRHYSLTAVQAEVFVLVATVFLCRLCLLFVLTADMKAEVERKMNPLLSNEHQLVHLMLGKGGTGKSHIIQALVNLAHCWGASRCLVLCGTSGIAGCLIGGRTLHNVLNLNAVVFKTPPLPSAEQVELWSWVVLGICDEVSMMHSNWFYGMHDRGLQLCGDLPGFFAGRNWLFAGDFSQLPPVRGTPAYLLHQYMMEEITGHTYREWVLEGCKLWPKYMVSVSHLHHSLRHGDAEPLLKETLEAMHSRTVTRDLMERFNDGIQITPERQPGPGVVYVTPNNAGRIQALRTIYNTDARKTPGDAHTGWKERGLLLIKMSLYNRASKHHKTDTKKPQMRPAAAALVREMDPRELGGFAGEVGIQLAGTHCARSGINPTDTPGQDCACCGSYVCTHNVQQQKGLVKSMWLKAIDVDLREGAVVTWDALRQTHVVQAVDVEAVIVKILLGPCAKQVLFPGLPPGVVPLTPTTIGLKVPLCGVDHSIGIVQVAMVSSRCITGHKMQGMTVPSVRLFNFLDSSIVNRHWLYVACSRVPTLAGLFSDDRLPESPEYWNAPYLPMDHEVARLYLMELLTTKRIMKARGDWPSSELQEAIAAQTNILTDIKLELQRTKGGN